MYRMRHCVARVCGLFLTLSAVACSTLQADTITGRVVRVIDGDTVLLRGAGLGIPPLRVRLAGIDAPELRQPYGPEAKRALEKMVLDAIVVVDWTKRDRYRRILGWVRVVPHETSHRADRQPSTPQQSAPDTLQQSAAHTLQGTALRGAAPSTINHLLLASGHAWHAVRYSRDPDLACAQAAAARDRRGLWATLNRLPPWDFRRNRSGGRQHARR